MFVYVLLADISPDYLLSLRERAADHYRHVYSIGVLITPNSVCIRAIVRFLRTRIKCNFCKYRDNSIIRVVLWICFQRFKIYM